MKRLRIHLTPAERRWLLLARNVTIILLLVELLAKGHP